jgi:hypothetical protein
MLDQLSRGPTHLTDLPGCGYGGPRYVRTLRLLRELAEAGVVERLPSPTPGRAGGVPALLWSVRADTGVGSHADAQPIRRRSGGA